MPHKDIEKRRASNRASSRRYQQSEKGKIAKNQYRASLKYQRDDRVYKSSPRALFLDQRRNAKRRGIPFLLTFEEWWNIWERSGRWEQRGCRQGDYVMARPGDTGPYSADNVKIIEVAENAREQNDRRAARSRDSM